MALALHACGAATDYAMLQAQRCGAAFVVSPCCIGKVVAANSSSRGSDCDAAAKRSGGGGSGGENRGTNQEAAAKGGRGELLSLDLPQPRSQWMRSALAAGEGISGASTIYAALARAADISHRGGEAVEIEGQGSISLPEGGLPGVSSLPGGVALLPGVSPLPGGGVGLLGPGSHSYYPAAEAEGQGSISLPEGGLPGVSSLPGGVAPLPGSHSYPALALLAKSNVELDRLLAAEESSGWVKVRDLRFLMGVRELDRLLTGW